MTTTPTLDYNVTMSRLKKLLQRQRGYLNKVEMYQNQAQSILSSLESEDMIKTVRHKIAIDTQRNVLAAAFIDFMKMDAGGIHDALAEDVLMFIDSVSVTNDLNLAVEHLKHYNQTIIKDPHVYCLSDADLITMTERILSGGGGE
jgi:hypothetical protein